MGKKRPSDEAGKPEGFIDVVYLSDKTDMPAEVKRLFRQKKVSSWLLPFDKYDLIRRHADLVGIALIDAEGMSVSEDQQLGHILGCLERDNVPIVLLTQPVRRRVRSFSLVSTENSFSMSDTGESISVDDLWACVSVNLAHRKHQNRGIAVKTPSSMSVTERLWTSHPADETHPQGTFVDSLKEQLRLAGLVQRDFLPSHLPNTDEVRWAATFLPAEWVSGDIYDVARIDEQHIGFYVADAVGHSMPAALLTMFIKQALVMRQTIENRYRIFTPTEAMTNLNQRMTGQKLSGYQFATCCYCLLNVKTRHLTFARAGHPYPILLRQDQPPQQLEVRGSLLGVFENAEFAQRTIPLQAGDRLLLYSDGAEPLIGQPQDETGFQFTDEFLALKDAPITEIIDQLTEAAERREMEPAEVDDQTLLGLEIL